MDVIFEIGDLIIRGIPHLKKVIKRSHASTSHLNKKEVTFFYDYLEKLDDLYHTGGEIYRLVIAPSKDHVKDGGVGGETNAWTLNKDALEDIYKNIMGDFLAGFFEPDDKDIDFWDDDIKQSDVNTYLVTARIPSRIIEPKNSFQQCLSFPEEQEVIIDSPNRINVKSIELYK